MSDKITTLLLGGTLLISESFVMVLMHFLGMTRADHWIKLLLDATAVSVVVILAVTVWLKYSFDISRTQMSTVAAKIAAAVFIAESGLMSALHLSGVHSDIWYEALLDGVLFAVMTAPIIYHWALKPVIREHPTWNLLLPIQMCVVISFAVLMFDLSLPLGVAAGVPYIILVLVGYWFPDRHAPLILAVLGSVLTVVGFVFSEQGGVSWMVLANRGLAVFIIWVTAVLVMKYKLKTNELERSHNELEARVVERTRELRENELQYRRLVENMPQILYSFSEETGGSFYSPHVEDVLGWSPTYLSEHPHLWHDSIHPDDLPMVDNALKDLWDCKGFDLEYRIRDSNGNWRWLHDRNILIRKKDGKISIDGLAADITDTKTFQMELEKAHGELEQSEAKFRNFYQIVPDVFMVTNLDTGLCVDVNQGFSQVTGYSREDVINKTTSEIGLWEDTENQNRLVESLKENGIINHLAANFRCKDGASWPGIMSACVVQLNGQPHILSSTKNVSELYRVQEELKLHRDHLEELVHERTLEVLEKTVQLEKALESEKKYSSLQQQFVSLFSHEFRTPLTIIDGSAQRIIRTKDEISPDQLMVRGEKIRDAVERMVELIEITLYASRLDAGKVEMRNTSCDPRDVIKKACEIHREVSPSHDIRFDLDALPLRINGDVKLLEHVFTSLLSNAIMCAPDTPLIEVRGWAEDDYALISVKDHGEGISTSDLPHMFERYFRAENSTGMTGTGIHLNVSKELVNMHGGTLEVSSAKGEGSTFTVRLPICT